MRPADKPDMTGTPVADASVATQAAQDPVRGSHGRNRASVTESAEETFETIAIVRDASEYGRHAAPSPPAGMLVASGLPTPGRTVAALVRPEAATLNQGEAAPVVAGAVGRTTPGTESAIASPLGGRPHFCFRRLARRTARLARPRPRSLDAAKVGWRLKAELLPCLSYVLHAEEVGQEWRIVHRSDTSLCGLHGGRAVMRSSFAAVDLPVGVVIGRRVQSSAQRLGFRDCSSPVLRTLS